MEKQSLKKTILILFVAVIFVASYAAFGGTGGNTTHRTTTTSIPNVYPAAGTANAIITGYSPSMGITAVCKNASVNSFLVSEISKMLSNLSSKGYVSTYYQINNTFKLETGSFNATKVYSYVAGNISSHLSCTTFSASASIALPQSVTLIYYYGSGKAAQPLSMLVPAAYRNYTLPLNLTENMSNVIAIRIFALFTANATTESIYNMSIEA